MFRAHVLIIRSKLHYTSSGIITPIGCRLVHRLYVVELCHAEYVTTYRLKHSCSDTSECRRDGRGGSGLHTTSVRRSGGWPGAWLNCRGFCHSVHQTRLSIDLLCWRQLRSVAILRTTLSALYLTFSSCRDGAKVLICGQRCLKRFHHCGPNPLSRTLIPFYCIKEQFLFYQQYQHCRNFKSCCCCIWNSRQHI